MEIRVSKVNELDRRKWEEIGTFEANKARVVIVQLTGAQLKPRSWNETLERTLKQKGLKSHPMKDIKIEIVK